MSLSNPIIKLYHDSHKHIHLAVVFSMNKTIFALTFPIFPNIKTKLPDYKRAHFTEKDTHYTYYSTLI